MTTTIICPHDDTKKNNTQIDPFYSEKNISQIRKADRQIREGKVVVHSIDELEAMEIK